MRIVEYYSHLNGLEYLKVHKPNLWDEVAQTIRSVDAEQCRTKVSNEKRRKGQLLYAPKDMNAQFKAKLKAFGWKPRTVTYYVTADESLARQTVALEPAEQKRVINQAGRAALVNHNQTDFVKDRVAIEVQFGKYSFVAYDLFVKHMAFFVLNEIDVGIEILPMKEMLLKMSSGPASYENELYNLIRQGRSTPAVPLVIVGIAP